MKTYSKPSPTRTSDPELICSPEPDQQDLYGNQYQANLEDCGSPVNDSTLSLFGEQEGPPLSQQVADRHTAIEQIDSQLQSVDDQIRKTEAALAHAQSDAERLLSEGLWTTSDGEQATQDALHAELDGLNQRRAELVDDRAQATDELATLTELYAVAQSDQTNRDCLGEILPTAERLDTTRDIKYLSKFGIEDESIHGAAHNPAQDPDQKMREQLERQWNAGGENGKDYENCCIYVLHTLEEAGYDLDAEVEVNGQVTTARRLVLIHAESLMPDRETELTAIAKDEQHRYHAVLKGVVTALTATNQGVEVDTVHDIRPGDLLQWWTEDNSGHTTIIHKVRSSAGLLTGASNPMDPSLRSGLTVDAVAVLGSHQKQRSYNQGQARRGEAQETEDAAAQDLHERDDHVYVTDFIELNEDHTGTIPYKSGNGAKLAKWWVVRPSGSDWAKPIGGL